MKRENKYLWRHSRGGGWKLTVGWELHIVRQEEKRISTNTCVYHSTTCVCTSFKTSICFRPQQSTAGAPREGRSVHGKGKSALPRRIPWLSDRFLEIEIACHCQNGIALFMLMFQYVVLAENSFLITSELSGFSFPFEWAWIRLDPSLSLQVEAQQCCQPQQQPCWSQQWSTRLWCSSTVEWFL